MKIAYNWLKEFIDFDWSVKELADKLTFAGIEIEGIEELPGGPSALLGDRDWQLDLEITPNRPDCLSLLGLAREIRALNGGRINVPESKVAEDAEDVKDLAKVEIEDKSGCPRYVARVITGVKVAESPEWLRKKIESVGLRPINNVADITNLVLYEFGHPLHAFDYDKLAEHKIVVRRAVKDEALTTLDGVERKLSPEYLVIADARRPMAIAGIMGGLESEISPATKNVLLESAYFDPPLIRRGSKNLGLKTDASYRFERGADPNCLERAADRAARLISEIAGGQAAKGRIDASAKKFPASWEIELDPAKARSLLGADIPTEKMTGILSALELSSNPAGNKIKVTVPCFRADLTRPADLIEEIGRIYGYDNLPDKGISPWSVPGQRRPKDAALEMIRQAMTGLGFCQHYGLTLADPGHLAKLGLGPESPAIRQKVELANPLSDDLSMLRTMLLPGLLQAGLLNLNNGMEQVNLFECGLVFVAASPAPTESLHLGGLICGPRRLPGWDSKPEPVDFYDLKGRLESLFSYLKIEAAEFAPASKEARPFLHPGRSADVVLNGKVLGWAGQLNPKAAQAMELKQEAYCFELELEPVIGILAGHSWQFNGLPRFPAVKRDLAVAVSDQVAAQSLFEAIKQIGGQFLEKAELFDLYAGQQVGAGRKSLAFSLSYRHPERTLTDAEVNQVHQEIVKALKDKFGAEIR